MHSGEMGACVSCLGFFCQTGPCPPLDGLSFSECLFVVMMIAKEAELLRKSHFSDSVRLTLAQFGRFTASFFSVSD